jgi:signal transduction histidine kinase
MISLQRLINRGIDYIKDHPQLLMTLLLVVVIPIAFLISGQQFLSAARSNQERLEMDRVGMMHDLFSAYIRAVNFEPATIQREIEVLASVNPDITKFQLAREENNQVRIIASLDPNEIETVAENQTAYRLGNTNPNEAIITPYAKNGVRYWQSFRLVRDGVAPDHYIFIETSLEHVDELFAARILSAYYWLLGLLGIIMILLLRHVRLIDYAYLYKETKRAIEMKDLFTNMIAHELRAPLTAVRGYASMIRERSSVDAETKKNASEIEEASKRLIVIVSDLLDLARIQSGKMSIELGTVHLSGLVRSVIEALHPSADEKHITLTIDDTAGNLSVIADEKRLYQALTNVLSNAIKYTKEGTITLSLTGMSDRVELRVKDTGMGISSEDQKKLFAPFFRASGEGMGNITGTGLGMWITQQLIELMKGSIGVESIKGVGTHVIITMPKVSK